MPILNRKITRTSKPNYPVRPDRGNPVSAKCNTALVINGAGYDAASNLFADPNGGKFTTLGGRRCFSANGASNGYLQIPASAIPKRPWYDSPATLLFSIRYNAATAQYDTLVGMDNTGFFFRRSSGGNLEIRINGTSTGSISATWVTDEWNTFLITGGTSGTARIYNKNGEIISSPSIGSTSWTVGSLTFLNGGSSPNSVDQLNGAVDFGFLLYDEVSDATAKSLISNPWQLLQPIQQPVFIPSAGGGTTDAAGDISSTATLTGEGASTVEAAASIVASATFTGDGAATAESELSVTSTGQIDWIGDSVAQSEAAIDINATSTFTAEGSASAASEADIQASATFTGEAEATASSEANISSTGQVDWVGESLAAGQAALGISATSNLTAEGAATAEADLSIDSSSDLTFTTEGAAEEEEEVVNPSGGGGWTTWAAKAAIKDKKLRAMVEQDEELMRMIAMMLPELVATHYQRHGVSNLPHH